MPGAGADGAITRKLRLEARVIGDLLELRGYKKSILKAVMAKYPNFTRANGNGYEHNAAGIKLALDLLTAEDEELANNIRRVLGIRTVRHSLKLLAVPDVRQRINAAGVSLADIMPIGTNQFKITVKPQYAELLLKLPDASVTKTGVTSKGVSFIAVFNPRPHQPEAPAQGAGSEARRESVEAKAGDTPEPGNETQTPDTNPLRIIKFLRRPTAALDGNALRNGQKIIWKDTGMKTFAVRKHGSWYAGRSADGTIITFHEGNAAAAGQWLTEAPQEAGMPS